MALNARRVNLSVIISTHNRVAALQLTLEHLTRQHYPFDDFEVCVVDDGSQDETVAVLTEYARHLPLRFWSQSRQGASAGRNRAIDNALGKNLVFIDDDVFVAPDFLQRHAGLLARYPGQLIRGPVINVCEPMAAIPTTNGWRHYTRNYLCTSNASVQRDLMLRAGLFDPTFRRWEDAELGVRLKKLGVRRHFDPGIYVYHWKPPLTHEERMHVAALDGHAAAQLYLRYRSWGLWLRSGLHLFNRVRNKWLLRAPWLPSPLRQKLEVENSYLRAGMLQVRGW